MFLILDTPANADKIVEDTVKCEFFARTDVCVLRIII